MPIPRKLSGAIVIEGTATILARRALPALPIAAAAPGSASGDFVGATGPAAAPLPFGRRPEHRRPPERDLVFQGAAARPFAGVPASSSASGGLYFFGRSGTRRVAALSPGLGRLAGVGAALVLLALPAGLSAGPLGAVATRGAGLESPLVLEEVVTSIRPRGIGAVLSVEGLIRNLSDDPAAVPPLRIALAESGGEVRTKALAFSVARLGPSRVLRFHSAVAVAKGTRGEVAVDFVAASPAPGKTLAP